MSRSEWIEERRKMAKKRYDTIFSVDYDEKWGEIEEVHRDMIDYFINMIPSEGRVLDAACGTGKYWEILRKYNIKVKGIDQSYKMLEKALRKQPQYSIEKLGLQELEEDNRYHGIMCVDAMENVFPEDWDRVLDNFYNALKAKGVLYFTVETVDKDEKDNAFNIGRDKGIPIIYGEVAHEGGYHYYPEIDDVRDKLLTRGFSMIKEISSQGYYHFMIKKV